MKQSEIDYPSRPWHPVAVNLNALVALRRSSWPFVDKSFSFCLFSFVAGKTRYSVTFSRIYRDAEGQWKTTQSFGRNDLLVLAKVADRAHSRIFELQRTEDEFGQAA